MNLESPGISDHPIVCVMLHELWCINYLLILSRLIAYSC